MKNWCWLPLCASVFAQGPARRLDLPRLLDRLAQHCDSFRKLAPGVIGEETLQQKTPGGNHEIVSAYAFGTYPESPTVIHEIRKVISVDGKRVISAAKARQAMTLGLQSSDDKLKKKLLEDFERYGLKGAVTDLGQVILLFSARHRKEYHFEAGAEQVVGLDRATVVKFEQAAGAGGVTVFRNNGTVKEPLRGELLLRSTDGVPLRVTITAAGEGKLRDELSVDYSENAAGCVLPVSVSHREYIGDQLTSENMFHYSNYRPVVERK